MSDILCPVCNHSINQHQAQGCYTRRPVEDKTPGDYCPCKQSAADIALTSKTAQKTILDVCCGIRMFWFDKSDERVIFCDKRKERHILNYDCGDYDINVSPNVLSDFVALPFPSNHFQVVVFDPPHLEKIGKNSWTYKKYGSLDGEWRFMLRDGFSECFRVLAPAGVLIFKWSSVQIPISEVLKLTREQPLFGHPSGRNGLTHWVAFMKSNAVGIGVPLQSLLFREAKQHETVAP